jgi:hypothetical protein
LLAKAHLLKDRYSFANVAARHNAAAATQACSNAETPQFSLLVSTKGAVAAA